MPSFPPPRELTVAPYPVLGRRASIALLMTREAGASKVFSPHASHRNPVRSVSTTRSPSSTHSSVRDSDQFIAGFSQKGQTTPRIPFQSEGLGGRESRYFRSSSISSRPTTGTRVGFFQFRRSQYSLRRSQYVFPFFMVVHRPRARPQGFGTWYPVRTLMRRRASASQSSKTTRTASGNSLSENVASYRPSTSSCSSNPPFSI